MAPQEGTAVGVRGGLRLPRFYFPDFVEYLYESLVPDPLGVFREVPDDGGRVRQLGVLILG